MDIGSIFLIFGLFILVALFISRPFLSKRVVPLQKKEHELSALLAERDQVINALVELDFDHVLGKIPEEDYPTQRTLLIGRGVKILHDLDSRNSQAPEDAPTTTRLENAIAARRTDSAVGKVKGRAIQTTHKPDDDIEALLAVRRRNRSEKAGGFCPQCGNPVQLSDRFCPKCGNPLVVEEEQSA
jgi:hypothetical protein